MIFDLIFAILVAGLLTYSEQSRVLPLAQADQAMAAEAPPAPYEVADVAISQLACLTDPDPTIVLRTMMDHRLIYPGERQDFESYSCFPIRDGMSLAGLNVNTVCGGVISPTINAENPDLYPPNERIHDDERYQMIAFGSNEDLESIGRWRNSMFAMSPEEIFTSAEGEMFGVIGGLYSPSISRNEIYCDDVLANDVAFAVAGEAEMDYMPPSDGSASDGSVPMIVDVPPPPAPPTPAAPPPAQ